jgi:hypothetical protein
MGPHITLQRRSDDSVSIFHHGRQYRRESGSSGRWLKRTVNGWRRVIDYHARRLERAYQRRDEIKKVRRFPREWDLKLEQRVYCPAFGSGKIVAIKSGDVTVAFGEQDHKVDAHDLVTRAQAEMHWYAYWFSGAKRRFEEGKRLAIVKNLCRFGEWQAFLDKYDYPRSTADDLIRRYEADMKCKSQQLPGNRAIELAAPGQQDSESTSDSDADERKALVGLESEKRAGRKPSDHATDWAIRIKLPPDVLKLCREKYKEPDAKDFWQRAAYRFVGLDPDKSEAAIRAGATIGSKRKSTSRKRKGE